VHIASRDSFAEISDVSVGVSL